VTTLFPLALLVPWAGGLAIGALDGRRRGVGRAAVLIMCAHVAMLSVLLARVLTDGPQELVTGGWPAGVGIRLRVDALGATFALLSSAVLLASIAYATSEGVRLPASPALVLLLAGALTGLCGTADVFSFYVFFELAMVTSYVLASAGESPRHFGGAYVFAVVNLVGTFLFLLGIAGLYHLTGTLDMATVADRVPELDPAGALLVAVTFFTAFGVKLGLFPFHFWLPPVYIGVVPSVAAALSGALANIGTYGLLRFGGSLLPEQLDAGSGVLIGLGAASIVYGSVQALSRRRAAEVLAYSSIGQVGYVLVALGVGGRLGLAAAVIYAVVNSLNKTLLFLASGVRGWLVGAAFMVGALSVAGIPPAAGFVGKLALLRTAIEQDSIALVVLVVLGAALSFVYMFQIQQHDFWHRPPDRPPARPAARLVCLGVAAVVLVLGAWPEPLLALGDEAAAAIVEGP
jgi:multicomponent Na+:H+ antiporter subunit D